MRRNFEEEKPHFITIGRKQCFYLTHSAREYFEKLSFKKTLKNEPLNGCISKARANSESKLTFSESSFNFLQNNVFCALCPGGYTAGGSASYNPRCLCQRLVGHKELRHFKCYLTISFTGKILVN